MRPVRELPVAFPDLVAGPSHQGVLRQRTKDLIHFPQVHIALPQPPPALREPRNRPQVGLRRPGQVKVPHCCSASNSATSDSSLYLPLPLRSPPNSAFRRTSNLLSVVSSKRSPARTTSLAEPYRPLSTWPAMN